MKLKFTLSIAILAMVFSVQSQELEVNKFGKGIFNLKASDSSWSMKFAARMQFLGIANWDDVDGVLVNPEQNFLVRRARFKFGGHAFTPKLVYKLELGLSNRDISGASQFTSNAPRYILDAVMKWNFHENFVLWFGQTKLPGNRERVISSGNLSLVDRSLLNSRFNIDRDIGLQLHHKTNIAGNFIIKEIISVAQGEGRNITTGNLGGHQYTGRLEVLPFGEFLSDGDYKGSDLKREETPKLGVGLSYDFNNNAVKNRSNQGSYMITETGFYETDVTTLFLDAMFKYDGFSLMAEYANRDAEDPVAKNTDGTETGSVVQIGNGLNLQAGYVFDNDWELTGRYTKINLDENVTGRLPQSQYTFGISKFFVGHNLKVQSDISYLNNDSSNNGLMYRLQFDIHF